MTMIFCLHYRYTALHGSSLNGYTTVARYLLDVGANVNSTTDEEDAPLTVASKNGYLDVVKLLIERNATVDHKGDNGFVVVYLEN